MSARPAVGARFRLYRFQHADGTAKDWAIRTTETGVEIRFGRSGRSLRRLDVPSGAPSFKASTPAAEAERRIHAQLRQGYHVVGEVTIDGRGLPRIDVETAPNRLHWTVEVPAEVDFDGWAGPMLDTARDLARVLCNHGYLERHTFDRDAVVLHASDGFAVQVVGIGDEPHSGQISRRTRRGSGSSACPPRTAEVLFFLGLAKRFPEFTLADDREQAVAPTLADNPLLGAAAEAHAAVAEDLGLIPRRIRWHTLARERPPLFY
jgi:hypothetical protein